jgi:hypothetical protein
VTDPVGLPLVTVTNGPLIDPQGRPFHRAPVTITAIVPSNPFLLNGSGSVLGRTVTDTETDGVWRATLIPTSQYGRADAYYLADETQVGGTAWPFRVPDSGGPYRLEELLIAELPKGDGYAAVNTFAALSDVNSAGKAAGRLLAVGSDGRIGFYPPTIAVPPPTYWHGSGPPPAVIPGAAPGDVYIDDDADSGAGYYTLGSPTIEV